MNELDIYDRQGFGNQSGFGKQPALLVVDLVNGFANPDEFGGGNIGEAIGLLRPTRPTSSTWNRSMLT